MTNTEKLPGSMDIYLEGIAAGSRVIQHEYQPNDPTIASHKAMLNRLNQIESLANSARIDLVRNMRAQGLTWSDIAAALGVSRQAAHERFSSMGR